MNQKPWWLVSIAFMIFLALTLDVISKDEFDPQSLPSPAAGSTAETTRPQYSCDNFIYSISEDGVKYVRESGGGIQLAAKLDNEIDYFQFGRHGSLSNVDRAEVDSVLSKKLEFALNNCNVKHLPSGVNFAYRLSIVRSD
jgi:hypothetical protein